MLNNKKGKMTMNNEYKRLPDAEMDIMNYIWESGKAVSSVEIQDGLKGQHDWSLAVILNLLARLTERGFVTAEKHGKYKYYSAIVEQEDYLQQESKTIIDRIFGGSVSKLICSLYNGKNLSKDDINSLKDFIDEKFSESDE